MRIFFGLLLGLWVTAVRADESVVLILGDSLSAAYGMQVEQGWVSLLERRLRAQGYPHRVVNASISGETTRGGLDRLDSALIKHQPGFVVIELGANDGLRGQSLEEMAANLRRIIDLSRQRGARPLLVRMRLPPNYGPDYTERFVQVYEQVGDQTGVGLAPFLMQGVSGNERYMLDDGIHPNADGQPLILENVWPSIESLLRATAGLNSPSS